MPLEEKARKILGENGDATTEWDEKPAYSEEPMTEADISEKDKVEEDKTEVSSTENCGSENSGSEEIKQEKDKEEKAECSEPEKKTEETKIFEEDDLPEKTDEQNGGCENEQGSLQAFNELKDALNVEILARKELENKVIQTLKENKVFQTQVRQGMQQEIEEARKKLKGEIFIPLLKEIAELYMENRDVVNDMESGIPQKKVRAVFEIMEEMLEEYGCEIGESEIGSKRKPKSSKIRKTIPTGIKDKQETVAKSYNPWIIKEPFVIYPEYVDVYVYDPNMKEETESDNGDKADMAYNDNTQEEEEK